MLSPFPGMDPYLEGLSWPNVHHRLADWIARQLGPQLRPRYIARLETRYVAESVSMGPFRILYPDVDVTVARQVQEPTTTYEADVAPPIIAPPLIFTLPPPPLIKLASVEIRDAQKNRLVTSIEVLSPVNKGEGFAEYQAKRQAVIQSPAHLLEIDLLRQGYRPVPFDHVEKKDRPLVEQAAYFVFLTRRSLRNKVAVWPIPLREPLPVVPVPLDAPDPDAALDLGAALRTIYDEAAYDLSIDYRQPPEPPLTGDDAAWADALLREQGQR
jgi:hypothetical protein